ncbi:putative diacylglycerol kinase (ATP) [Helianthus annuus]|uniref:Diacylglycerol kinase n=1 Tax=Helianthus annuus TaxID=4232 RepID=A0A9K3N598_HELAN|nr:putative diacylglycerol kinase (ATP) [Helianthus annuus]
MDSSKPEPSMNKTSSKSSSVIDSIKGCTLSGMRVPKEELRRKITMPEYLRFAIRDAMASKDIEAGKHHYEEGGDTSTLVAPESPLVVFVNSKSGGRQGSELQSRLQEFMGDEQVFDLHNVKPHEFVQYGLACMESIAALGDCCAQETRERLRIVVAGGDGTVGWVLGCLGELHERGRDPVPPTAIIPLGTGNDLSRSFGWGGSFSIKWKKAIKRVLDRAINAPLARLDSWNLVISMPAGAQLDTPYALKQTEEVVLDKDLEIEGHLPKEVSCYQGVFYNYFSIGMDAQVAYGFHQLRNEKPYLAHGRIANKIIYSGYCCKQGWFFTPCINDPGLRQECILVTMGLKNILRMHIKRLNSPNWELINLPANIRSIVALNLPSYASGRNPWGNLKPEYLEKKGFVEANSDDGLLEIFGFKQGWHASLVMVDLISAKHIAQAAAIRFELRGGTWRECFMQVDGEPWKQPMNNEYSTFLDIKRVPFQSILVKGENNHS